MLVSAYRTLLHELAVSSKTANVNRFKAHIRATFKSTVVDEKVSSRTTRAAQNAAAFLRAHRIHQELLERYNPTINLTSEEHVAATAHRVGLRLTDEDK